MAIQPMDNPRQNVTRAKLATGSGIAAAVALAVSVIAPWEGKSNDPYLDIVKVKTVCYGETRVEMRRYSDAECKAMLERAVANDFANQVFACTPALRYRAEAGRPNEAAAAISLAYNVGVSTWCKSTADRLFDAHDWAGGCRAIARYDRAGGRVVKGLQNRRAAEVALCLKGL